MSKLRATYGEEVAGRIRTAMGRLKVLSEDANKMFADVELWLLNDRPNRNHWRFLNLEKHAEKFVDKPILTAYKNGRVGDGHNFRMKRDGKTGEEYASFTDAAAERIVGWFPSAGNIRVEIKDGVRWIVGKARIWAYYNRELVELLAVQGGRGMDISIEALAINSRMEGETEIIDEYEILGTTILGEGVTPAVEGAYIYRLNWLNEELKDFKLRVAAYAPTEQTAGEEGGNVKGVYPMSKKKLALLQRSFPTHTVLAASEDGLNVLLMSEKGEVCAYTFDPKDEGAVMGSKFAPVLASVSAKMPNGSDLTVSLDDAMDNCAAAMLNATTRAEKAEKELTEARDTIKTMREKEQKRRVSAAKAAVKRELEEINAERSANEQIDESVCAEVEKEIDCGTYTDMENAEGEWTGEKAACNALKARCMDAVKKMDRDAMARQQGVNITTSPLYNSSVNEDSPEAYLRKMGVTIRK